MKAVVITCSDYRVTPEVLFNTTMGELFTIRSDGNVKIIGAKYDIKDGSVEILE